MLQFYEKYWEKGRPEWTNCEIENLIKIIKPFIRGKVLDVGCGEGTVTNSISQLDYVDEIFGIDISKTAINLAKKKYSNISFKISEAEKIPYKDNSFKTVLLIEVLEHILDIEGLFIELNRVLELEGYIVITTTDYNFLKKILIALIWEKYFYATNPHIKFLTKESLKKLLEFYGFKVVLNKWNGNYFGLMPKGQIVIAKKIKEIQKKQNNHINS